MLHVVMSVCICFEQYSHLNNRCILVLFCDLKRDNRYEQMLLLFSINTAEKKPVLKELFIRFTVCALRKRLLVCVYMLLSL